MPHAYATAAQYRLWVSVASTEGKFADDELDRGLQSSASFIDVFCGRTFRQFADATRTYYPQGRHIFRIDDFVDPTLGSAIEGATFERSAEHQDDTDYPFEYIRFKYSPPPILTITGTRGWPSTPPLVTECNLEHRAVFRLESPRAYAQNQRQTGSGNRNRPATSELANDVLRQYLESLQIPQLFA